MFKKILPLLRERLHPSTWKGEWIASFLFLLLMGPLFGEGHITFSDLAFGRETENYLNYVIGVFNEQLGTANWFNIPRLFSVTPALILAKLLGGRGHIFVWGLIYTIFLMCIWSFCVLYRHLCADSKHPVNEWALAMAATIYSINPWVLIRVQHVFILFGYALVPVALSWSWKLLGSTYWKESNFKLIPTLKEFRTHLLLGFVVSTSFAGIHFGIFIILCMIWMGVTFAGVAFIEAIKRRKIIRWFIWYVIRAGLAGGTFFLYAAYWAVPFVLNIVSGTRPSQNNVNAIETIVTFSRASAPQNISVGISYWWPMFEHAKLPITFWIGGYLVLLIAFLGVLYSRRFILLALTMVVFLIASGTHFEDFAPRYIAMVFDSVYPFGDMIRDPNKLYGVAILPVSIFFGYGIQLLINKVYPFKYRNHVFLGLGALSIFLWLQPIYEIYMMGYYKPVVWPKEYDELQAKLEELPKNRKILYLPVSDFAVDRTLKLSYPAFNTAWIQGADTPKATGDHMVFDTRSDTIFPYEGNDINVLYYLQYLHDTLESNSVDGFGGIVAKGGITHVVMRKDYPTFQEQTEKFDTVLKAQDDLTLIWSNGMMDLYEVNAIQADAELVNTLIYSTGGLERFTWLPNVLDLSSKDLNFVFAYDSHYPTLSPLVANDAIETNAIEDLVLTQLPKERFKGAADALLSASPHLRWSKIVLSGHDWEHYSHHFKIYNDYHLFDMGHGLAFTSTPLSVPHEAYMDPTKGTDAVSEPMQTPWTFFHTFENHKIYAKEGPNQTLHATIEDTESEDWQMLESKIFALEENMLYHFITYLPNVPDLDMRLRVGFYSKDGNRLGTEVADPIVLLPEPPERKQVKSFLSPAGTTYGRLEIRVKNPTTEPKEFFINRMSLYSLQELSTPNTIPIELPENDYSVEGDLWIRIFCSKQGGNLEILTSLHSETINAYCEPTSKFAWKKISTPAGIDRNIHIINRSGINAVNALVWITPDEWEQLKVDTLAQIQDKSLIQFVDSTEIKSTKAAESQYSNPKWVGGTVSRSLKGELFTQLDVLKDSTYTFSVHDNLPNPDDFYNIQIINSAGKTILNRDVTPQDPNRTLIEGPEYSGITKVRNLELSADKYDIKIKVNSALQPLVKWNALDLPGARQWLKLDPETQTVTRLIPLEEKAWGSILSKDIRIDSSIPLMFWFQYTTQDIRSLHGKIHYLDKNKEEIKLVYLDQITYSSTEVQDYVYYDTPPKDAAYVSIQFMARHLLEPSEKAQYTISNFQLWESPKSVGIDAISLIENNLSIKESPPAILDVTATRGKRRIQTPDSAIPKRIHFYETPIHHWHFTEDSEIIEPFAINAISFGLKLKPEASLVESYIGFTDLWFKCLILSSMGVLLIVLTYVPPFYIWWRTRRQRTLKQHPSS